MKAKNLGQLLPVGAIFQSTAKSLNRKDIWLKNRSLPRWKHQRHIFRTGEKDFFVKGKRRYFCEVMGISGIATGLHCWYNIKGKPSVDAEYAGPRWYRITYVVKILEN